MRPDGHPTQPPAASEIFCQLAGTWLLDRRIEGAGGGASMQGIARFERDPSGALRYRENGHLCIAGSTFEASRSYVFRPAACGFAVYFAGDPLRLFHDIVLAPHGGELIGSARHLCGQDLYDSRYAFRQDGSFLVRHDVVGPRKDYSIESFYTRPDPPQAAHELQFSLKSP